MAQAPEERARIRPAATTERMDGKGYPRGLKRDEMSVQARVMGIADIFEALTAKDRPYKKGKTLTESLEILGKFKLNGHVDPDLFDVFMWEKVYLKYAELSMDRHQIDEVDPCQSYPGYVAAAGQLISGTAAATREVPRVAADQVPVFRVM